MRDACRSREWETAHDLELCFSAGVHQAFQAPICFCQNGSAQGFGPTCGCGKKGGRSAALSDEMAPPGWSAGKDAARIIRLLGYRAGELDC